MSLQEEIKAIITSMSMSYDDKREKLMKLVTPQEVEALLPDPNGIVRLKEPLRTKTVNMRILHLSVVNAIFEDILEGNHDVECRSYNDYYKRKCSYVEDGVRYLIPFDAITFYVGYGEKARKVTVTLKNISCDGSLLFFYIGRVLDELTE